MQIYVVDWLDVLVESSDLPTYLAATYQPILVSGTSIKTINGQSLLGSGNIAISVDLTGYATTAYVDGGIGVALGIVASQYLPLAGGTMTGSLDLGGNNIINVETFEAVSITLDGTAVATQAYVDDAASQYLPLAGGTMTGNIDLGGWELTNGILSQWQQIDSTYGSFAQLYYNGLTVATEAYASNASNLSSGIVPIERLPVGTTSVTVAAGNHNHTASQIIDFAEAVDDELNACLRGTANEVTITYNDAANTLTVGLGANVPRLNAANTYTQPQVLPASTKSAPALRFGGTTNTGIYSAANGVAPGIGVAIGGQAFFETRDSGSGVVIHSAWGYCISSGQADGTADVRWVRNATGPTFQTVALGGLRVTTDGTALGPVACSNVTASGNIDAAQFRLTSDGNGAVLRAWAGPGNFSLIDGSGGVALSKSSGGTTHVGGTALNGALQVTTGGAVAISGTLRVGGGTVVQNILSATATLDFPSIAASSFADLTITVTGAVSGDTVIVNPIAGSATTDVVYTGWVSAANTVTIRASNVSSTTARDPASGTFRATVIRF
jgi:hypothetical protein